jgi:hypothetical protein
MITKRKGTNIQFLLGLLVKSSSVLACRSSKEAAATIMMKHVVMSFSTGLKLWQVVCA